MNIIVFEDENVHDLIPFTVNHASFEIRIASMSNIERICKLCNSNDKIYLIVRDEIADITRERFPNKIVNPDIIPTGFFLNGASIWDKETFNLLENNKIYSSNGRLIAIYMNHSIKREELKSLISDSLQVTIDINIKHISYLWDGVNIIPHCIQMDVEKYLDYKYGDIHTSAILSNPDNIFIGKGSIISPGCILDATRGPIIIDNNTIVDIGALIKGPIYIGPDNIINAGSKLNGSISLGPHSKTGGELSNVIFQGYSNKQHDGFLGNSFVGEWVNIGANTNNSNLKNNYSEVRVELTLDNHINTMQQFIGCYIGDYSRTGISTMINTGTVIGFGSNIFGPDFQKKYVDPFSWGKNDKVELDKFLQTCQKMKNRRDKDISEIEKSFITKLYLELS